MSHMSWRDVTGQVEYGSDRFAKQEQWERMASEAEIGVWVEALGAPLQGPGGISLSEKQL